LVRKHERKDHLEDTGIDGRTILTCSFTECSVSVWTRLNRFRMQSSGRLLKNGNGTTQFYKRRELSLLAG
jgi:hypothetical protein